MSTKPASSTPDQPATPDSGTAVGIGSSEWLGETLSHELAEAFLRWPLPDSVCADLIATMPGEKHRVGTNLLSYVEAKQMMREIVVPALRRIAGLPTGQLASPDQCNAVILAMDALSLPNAPDQVSGANNQKPI